ncbi:MAG: UDP-N-acetylmuramoyl-L-alanine--D-glutamate ligase [Verrucomicrobiales bacterium]
MRQPAQFAGLKIAALGAGRSGLAAARVARQCGAECEILDSGNPANAEALRGEGFRVATGPAAVEAAAKGGYDLGIISPGIDLNWELPQALGAPIIGEIEFAFRLSEAAAIAITGTNGKTTATELTAAMFKAAGINAEPCGNYGVAYSETLARPLDAAILEVSSFQLEAIETFRPAVAVWMNFAPDHLDRYAGIGDYRRAKMRIFENQTAADFAVVNGRDGIAGLAAKTITFSAFAGGFDFALRDGAIHFQGQRLCAFPLGRLRGRHNAENLMACLAAGHARGLAWEPMLAAAEAYVPPRHRCEFVRAIGGIEFLNDSKATNLHALESALAGREGRVVLIAGGKQKGLDYAPLRGLVAEKVSAAVLIGEIKESLAAAWDGAAPCETAADLDAAVRRARDLAAPGEAVLFSPGTSSFDMFTGYEQRGDVFCQIVNQLPA